MPNPKVAVSGQNQKPVNSNGVMLNMIDNIECFNFYKQSVTTVNRDFSTHADSVMQKAPMNNSLLPRDLMPSSSSLPNVCETINSCTIQPVSNKNKFR